MLNFKVWQDDVGNITLYHEDSVHGRDVEIRIINSNAYHVKPSEHTIAYVPIELTKFMRKLVEERDD